MWAAIGVLILPFTCLSAYSSFADFLPTAPPKYFPSFPISPARTPAGFASAVHPITVSDGLLLGDPKVENLGECRNSWPSCIGNSGNIFAPAPPSSWNMPLFTRDDFSDFLMGIVPLQTPMSKATFAMGCFWRPDALFGATKGVIRTRLGYSGGKTDSPQYTTIGDHTETIEIVFDPNIIRYSDLLHLFWANHDPAAIATKQYASIIFHHNSEQKALAERTLAEQKKNAKAPILTTIVPVKIFYQAEDYHQKYRLQKYPELVAALGLPCNKLMLTTSHVAARLNGYVVGQGGLKQFEEEAPLLGLSEEIAELVRKLVTRFQSRGLLYC